MRRLKAISYGKIERIFSNPFGKYRFRGTFRPWWGLLETERR
jgi:hypothetical protein